MEMMESAAGSAGTHDGDASEQNAMQLESVLLPAI